ncbi:MAG: MarR family transcriptional regulator [Clostridia bacterium]|nr:MarR family transcriptional regulator [Clostridia bacterium]
MDFSVDDCIAFLTNAGGKALDEGMNQRFKDADITRVQWTALYYIDKIENINQKELAEAMLISEPSTTNLVNRMVQAGFIQRVRESGARSKTLVLTDLGREKLETLRYIPIGFNQDATKTVSAEELEIFKKVLKDMVNNIKL